MSGSRIGRPSDSIGPIIQIDFKSNPAMAKPFRDWGDSGDMWAAFAEWYLDNKGKYDPKIMDGQTPIQ